MTTVLAEIHEEPPEFSAADRAIIDAHFRAILFLHKKCGNTFAVSRTLVLLYVAQMNMCGKPVYLKDVSDMLGICMPAASRLIVKLLAPDVTTQLGYGLIAQVPDHVDRRRSRLQLTRKGVELINNYLGKVKDKTSNPFG